VPYFVTDEKDLTSCVTGMFSSGKAYRPCNLCTLLFKGNADITLAGPRRTVADMKEVSGTLTERHAYHAWMTQKMSNTGGRPPTKAVCREWSIHPEVNPIFNLPGFDPFRNPSCRMHACDHGIFKRLLDLCTTLISKQPAHIKREFDDRFVSLIFMSHQHYSLHYLLDGFVYSRFREYAFFTKAF